ncbi:MAG TPA: M23 family metallopeptidase, partial [Gammaproteobacteria bacterium]|nr:M23 family metallopeptidase [Gammaproteobacteria bacterium]
MRRLGCAAALVTLAGCSEALDEDAGLSHAQYSERLEAVGVDQTLLGHEWLDAAHAALTEPTPVTLPYAESGGFVGHEATALGLAFSAVAGQKLRLEVTQPEPQSEGTPAGRIYADVFRIDALRDQVRYIWLGVLPLDESQWQIELPKDATYVVRVQPELLTDARYRVALELDAVLPFPVSGFHSDAVRSFFGAERDAGARYHEGVDIFAPRSTPVLAVSDGRATARVNDLGGNTVWLSTAGTSYYYAHLETQAITGTRWVRTGDVLGYVGNTGNAVTAPPHLHFGVYRWGRVAIDPLPLLGAHRFANELGVTDFEPRYVKTRASQLNLRRGPSPR